MHTSREYLCFSHLKAGFSPLTHDVRGCSIIRCYRPGKQNICIEWCCSSSCFRSTLSSELFHGVRLAVCVSQPDSVWVWSPSAPRPRRILHLLPGRFQVVGGIVSPVSDSYGKRGLVPARHRVAMARLALHSSGWVTVDDWESRQPDWSETVVTLRWAWRSAVAELMMPLRRRE